ncbi:cyclase family protein [Aureicoccus marinus]|uniref:cyclase family protein n=1 Tax=Aureicoccus marinus TaxID=754435 RepID=UPI002937030B|nr:cyclase family protein [Aureicoccus marinus]
MTIRLAEDQPPFRLAKGQDLSIPLVGGQENLNAWYIGPPTIAPHQDGDFVGSVEQGASTNFNTITFNPHAHVTHTECLGHISKEFHSVNRIFPLPFLAGVTLSVTPEKKGEDQLITEELLEESLRNLGSAPFLVKALLIRTLPNVADKRSQQYSHSNPPYLTEGAAIWLREMGVEHLLIDLPPWTGKWMGELSKPTRPFGDCQPSPEQRPPLPSSSSFPMKWKTDLAFWICRWLRSKMTPAPAVRFGIK